jgi:hypothetical protein
VQPPGDPGADPGGQPLDAQQRQRRGKRHQQGERHDVAGRRPARGEELGVVAQQVEQRLGHRKRPEDGEMDAPLG